MSKQRLALLYRALVVRMVSNLIGLAGKSKEEAKLNECEAHMLRTGLMRCSETMRSSHRYLLSRGCRFHGLCTYAASFVETHTVFGFDGRVSLYDTIV